MYCCGGRGAHIVADLFTNLAPEGLDFIFGYLPALNFRAPQNMLRGVLKRRWADFIHEQLTNCSNLISSLFCWFIGCLLLNSAFAHLAKQWAGPFLFAKLVDYPENFVRGAGDGGSLVRTAQKDRIPTQPTIQTKTSA
ncbi:unnamed protein product [Linum tenue]|uniref:Uncharacterized protein n=1 Tax=Linum tenue TaxID=586396 RepID=A0AAV0MJE4_9ROSI|nr:unnamed protein product [Linum tenue]